MVKENVETKLFVRGFGRVLLRNRRTGRIEGGCRFKNIVTEIGLRDFMVNQIHSDLTGSAVGFAGIGSSTVAPLSTQTALTAEFATATTPRVNVVGSLVVTRTMRSTYSYATDEATQSQVAETGLFQTNSAGAMFSRATFTASTKTTNQTLSFTYDVIFNTA